VAETDVSAFYRGRVVLMTERRRQRWSDRGPVEVEARASAGTDSYRESRRETHVGDHEDR
jgi:hypothetical protein